MNEHSLNCYASIIYRKSQQFFDQELKEYQIGCGQQFFLRLIYENQGISLSKLASFGYFDKGTTVKAVKRLEELGYIRRDMDCTDKRIHRAYTTEKSKKAVEAIYTARKKWNELLTNTLSLEETIAAEQLLEKIAFNASFYNKEKEMSK